MMTTKTLITRAQYMANSSELHHAYWLQFATPATYRIVRQHIGADAIRDSTDPHLNDIPLNRWDAIQELIKGSIDTKLKAAAEPCGPGKFSWSLSDAVCIAKAVAKEIKSEPPTITFDSDKIMAVFGVPGRLTHRTVKPGMSSGLWTNQRWISQRRSIKGYGAPAQMSVEIRFDDDCNNGHNTFAITANVVNTQARKSERDIAGGCMHDEIKQVFPELTGLIKWHLVSSDGPMHYIANTVFHAGDRDCHGFAPGAVSGWNHGVRFGNSPVTHVLNESFFRYLQERVGSGPFQVAAIAHDKTSGYQFKPKYTLVGYADKWHECPFDTQAQADEFCLALNTCLVEFVKIPTEYSEGKQRDFDAARSCAVWPEATDAELSAPPAALTRTLEARLPGLLADFRRDIEAAGLLWSPADYKSK